MRKASSAKRSPWPSNHVDHATFTIGAETGDNTINVGIQLYGTDHQPLGVVGNVFGYLAGDAAGKTVIGTGPTSIAIGTDGGYIPLVAVKAFHLSSEADGDIDLNIVVIGAATYYLVLVMPDGRRIVSDAITFA